ncbi:restriction endonuclease [Thioalkalivibrio thiocyanodenitrificans]|uniref:restriction endonuclease n=1 Tax=Thioalkalivibrio thiocyanodenitrificans TaxID=243063 RepID=UPI00037A463D|nr:restriction endonuclease [Thioalkalivibrio thiocyanodenitrificans]
MAILKFQEITLPMLKLAADGEVWSLADAREEMAKHFQLTKEELEELLPSGRQARFSNRVAWAKVYLERGGLLSSPKRAHFQITERGREVLQDPSDEVSIKFLSQYPEFQEFRSRSSKNTEGETDDENSDTPEETLESAYLTIRKNLASEVLERVKSCTPHFFEHLVVDLLLKMGYGRAGGGSGERVGQAGDEGIDGIISEDRLGLEMVYLQAKRWEGTVGRPEIQKFVGALHGKRARKGVFITTGSFSADAAAYVQTIDPKVALVDGKQLAEYMIDFGLGVSLARAYEVKRIDTDYFEE